MSRTLRYHKSGRFPSQWAEVENVACIDQKRVLLIAACVKNSFYSKFCHIFHRKSPGAYVPSKQIKARLFKNLQYEISVWRTEMYGTDVRTTTYMSAVRIWRENRITIFDKWLRTFSKLYFVVYLAGKQTMSFWTFFWFKIGAKSAISSADETRWYWQEESLAVSQLICWVYRRQSLFCIIYGKPCSRHICNSHATIYSLLEHAH